MGTKNHLKKSPKPSSSGFDNRKIARILLVLVYIIIVSVPFYSFFSTWFSSFTGGLLFWRAIKEFVLLVGLLLTGLLMYKDKKLRSYLIGQKIVLIIGLFIVWQLFVTSLFGRDIDATALGLTIQLRSVLFFIVASVAGYYVPVSLGRLYKLVLLPALGVVIFGLMQMFILPFNFLSHFGYQKGLTIPPYFTIDDQLDKLRIASTLRGPNPLGVYLITPIMLLVSSRSYVTGILKKFKNSNLLNNILYFVFCILLFIVMYGSHSRGAWLGLVAAFISYLFLIMPGKLKITLVSLGILAVIAGGATIYQYKNTSFIQDVVLHDNPTEGGEISSNQGHLDSLKSGFNDISNKPILGCGDGCAGPASVHNKNGAKISENYFIQTAQESGIIGLILLLAVFGLIAQMLYKKSYDPFAATMLASFVGICVASLTAHAWADDTIVYLWWGIAGLYLSRYSHSGSLTASTKRPDTSVQEISEQSI